MSQQPPARGPNYLYMTPLIFCSLPLIRLTVKNPPLRHKLYLGAVCAGLLHGFSLIFSANDDAAKRAEEGAYITDPSQLAARRAKQPSQ